MVDYAETGTAHRTTYGHFLAKGKWDDNRLEKTQKRESIQAIFLEKKVVYGYQVHAAIVGTGDISVQLSETLLPRKRVKNRYDLKCDSISSR